MPSLTVRRKPHSPQHPEPEQQNRTEHLHHPTGLNPRECPITSIETSIVDTESASESPETDKLKDAPEDVANRVGPVHVQPSARCRCVQVRANRSSSAVKTNRFRAYPQVRCGGPYRTAYKPAPDPQVFAAGFESR